MTDEHVTDEQAIRNLIEDWSKATAEGDIAGVLALMDPDAVFLGPGRPPMIGRQAFADSFRGATAKMGIRSSADIQEIRIVDSWAYCWSHLTVTVTPKDGGEAKLAAGDVLTIFGRESGEWLLVRDANMLAPR